MARIGRLARGVVTVARRRGVGYFGYLATGVLWPNLLYRFAWGPDVPQPIRAIFNTVIALSHRTVADAELRELAVVGSGIPSIADQHEVEHLMDRAHGQGVAGLADGFDRLIRTERGDVRFAALPRARFYRRRGAPFRAARDADRRAFNARFEASLLTEADARRALRDAKAKVPAGYREYAPIDFGGGLTIGRIASTDSGTGRWDFFNRHIVGPLVKDKRVLDLGSNNGSLPLMMLRAGAREVVAIEYTPQIADFARLNARILAWRDMRDYRIEVLTGDMRVFLSHDLGRFDVVTAFCSLYYLPERDMGRVIEKSARMGARLILQANDGIEDLPAQTPTLSHLMERYGYADVAIHAPAGFKRPLLVGTPTAMPMSAGLIAS